MSQGGSKLQIENLTHALQHTQDLSKSNSNYTSANNGANNED